MTTDRPIGSVPALDAYRYRKASSVELNLAARAFADRTGGVVGSIEIVAMHAVRRPGRTFSPGGDAVGCQARSAGLRRRVGRRLPWDRPLWTWGWGPR
jgi:hypothetical protein